jgi:hypothetical protein
MKKIIINQCYGGFGFSKPFIKAFTQVKPLKNDYFYSQEYRRDPIAIQLLEEHGTEWSSDKYAKLVVKNVPSDIFKYMDVGEYDGYESLVINWEKVSKRMVGIGIHSKRKALYQAIQAYLNSDVYK